MKLKNILSVICILVAMTSCSMEDDILNDVESKLQDLNPDKEAILSFHLSSNTLLTKSVGTATGDSVKAAGDKESKLNNCVLALMQGDDVLSVVTSTNITDGKVSDATFLTKVRSGLSVVAIVNVADPDAYRDATTRKGLNHVIDVDPNGAENLVKQGEAKIEFPADFVGSSSTTQVPTLPVTIPVTQLAAKIELSEFNVEYAKGVQKKSKVTLTSVSFENLNKKSKVFDEYALEAAENKDTKSIDLNQLLAEGADQNNEIKDCFAYSYANTKATYPVQMTLTFRIGEDDSMLAETVTKTYLINRNNASEEDDERGVKRGHLYRVKVTMTVNSHAVDTDVICYTNDWVHDVVAVDMSEANESGK